MIEILAEIDAPDYITPRGAKRKTFTAGIVLQDDIVIEAAPIVRKELMGKTRDYVRDYCARQGWRIYVVTETTR